MEDVAFHKLDHLKLILEQQSIVDSGIRLDLWALVRDQQSQSFNYLNHRLLASITASRQLSQLSTLLLTNADQIADHRFNLDQLLSRVSQEAFLLPGERDLFNLVPEPVILGDLNSNFTGLLLLHSEPEKPDLASLL